MSRPSLRRTLGVAVAALFALMGSVALKAQVGSTATISGTITDSSGAAVVGATVTVKNTGTGVGNMAVTDSQGRYAVPDLIIGTYEVDVEAAGLTYERVESTVVMFLRLTSFRLGAIGAWFWNIKIVH